MGQTALNLKFLDHCVSDGASLDRLRKIIDKIDKCRKAASAKHNLADVLGDPVNLESLAGTFGQAEFDVGLQLCLRLSLEAYEAATFTLARPIDGRRKLDFIHRTVGGWQQFDTVITLQFQDVEPTHAIALINPRRQEHWARLDSIPAGTVISIHVRSLRGKAAPAGRNASSEEQLALERYQAVFETVQHVSDQVDMPPTPQVQFEDAEPAPAAAPSRGKVANGARPGSNGSRSATQGARPGSNGSRQSTNSSRPATNGSRNAVAARTSNGSNGAGLSAAERARKFRGKTSTSTAPAFAKKNYAHSGPVTGTPSFSFKILINKMDTFVHAGNAHLIITHIKDYQGKVQFSAIRAEKKVISLDADSIWSAEIRNGETVMFEFFGPVPEEGFVKELAKIVNKYTQMDKLAG